MKELDWIILTSWSPPPWTPQLQQAGLHCSLLPLYIRVCVCVFESRKPIPPARRRHISHMNVNHLFNWLPWLYDLFVRRQGWITLLLLQCCFLSSPVCVCVFVISLASIFIRCTVTFDIRPSFCPPLSSLSIFSPRILYSFIPPFGPPMPQLIQGLRPVPHRHLLIPCNQESSREQTLKVVYKSPLINDLDVISG